MDNTYIGYQAGYSITTGTGRHIAVGRNALYANTTGTDNVALGYYAGASTTTGYANVFVGSGWYAISGGAGQSNTTGVLNTYVGGGAGWLSTTGSKNTILGNYNGNQGGLDIRTADNYIVLSDGDGNPRGVFDGSGNFLVGTTTSSGNSGVGFKFNPSATYPQLSLVGSASTNAATTLEMYSTGASAYRFYVGYGGTIFATSIVITAISDERLKENIKDIDTGLDSIMALKPRRFDWKDGKGQDKKNAAGFIAQEFETVFPESVGLSKAGADGIQYKDINHETLIPTLVKAIQELKLEFDAYKLTHP